MHRHSFCNHCPGVFGKDSSGLGNKLKIETKFNYLKIPHPMVVLAEMMIMKCPKLQPGSVDHQQKKYTVNL